MAPSFEGGQGSGGSFLALSAHPIKAYQAGARMTTVAT